MYGGEFIVKHWHGIVQYRSYTCSVEQPQIFSGYTLALFNITKTYNLFDDFFITSFICSFYHKPLEVVTPNNFALVTTSRSFSPTLTDSNACFFLENEILSSLNMSGFNWTLLFCDHSATSSAITKVVQR